MRFSSLASFLVKIAARNGTPVFIVIPHKGLRQIVMLNHWRRQTWKFKSATAHVSTSAFPIYWKGNCSQETQIVFRCVGYVCNTSIDDVVDSASLFVATLFWEKWRWKRMYLTGIQFQKYMECLQQYRCFKASLSSDTISTGMLESPSTLSYKWRLSLWQIAVCYPKIYV